MTKRFSFLFLLLFSIFTSYGQKILKTKTYYGNNNSHLPACIIETQSKLNKQKLKYFSKKTFDRHPEQRGKICTLLLYKNEPYAIIYNDVSLFNNKVTDTVFSFEDFKNKYKALIKKFELIKPKTDLKSHTIYGYYASLGSCSQKYDSDFLTIISKDGMGNYYMAYYSSQDNECHYIRPIHKITKGFERENEPWEYTQTSKAATKQIFYEQGNGDMAVKDLEYVAESDEKYVYYLLKMQ